MFDILGLTVSCRRMRNITHALLRALTTKCFDYIVYDTLCSLVLPHTQGFGLPTVSIVLDCN